VWNTPLMPPLFVAMAIVSGTAVASLLAAGNAAALRMLRLYMLWSAGAIGVMLISLLGTTAYGGSAQELAFDILTSGSVGTVFIGLGLVGGILAPILLLLAPFGRQQGGMLLSALLILGGDLAMRISLLMGPQIVQTLY
jgi:formate-dependent nitrite reductase membrane component NrfD